MEILAVYGESYKKWDKALNSVYQSLMKKLPKEDKELLRNSQRKWLAYKEAEFKFMPIHIQRGGGTLSRVITAQRQAAFIRNRVIELEAYEYILNSPP